MSIETRSIQYGSIFGDWHIEKLLGTGSGGKSGTNDASAEYVGWLRGVMAKDAVVWQAGELGKVDLAFQGEFTQFSSLDIHHNEG